MACTANQALERERLRVADGPLDGWVRRVGSCPPSGRGSMAKAIDFPGLTPAAFVWLRHSRTGRGDAGETEGLPRCGARGERLGSEVITIDE